MHTCRVLPLNTISCCRAETGHCTMQSAGDSVKPICHPDAGTTQCNGTQEKQILACKVFASWNVLYSP